jgi:ferredoxin
MEKIDMEIKDVFNSFEKLHSYSFSTIDDGYPEIRVAHFLTYDEDGLYFQTMRVKPFYKQLIDSKKVAVCALIADDGETVHDEEGLSYFPPGYYVRVSGDVKPVSLEELKVKAQNEPSKFNPLLKDIERYPMMTTFVLHSFKGELYDYDFEKTNRDHKLERQRFAFNGESYIQSGFNINKDTCIACGTCYKACTFDSIIKGDKYYSINPSRCDECGSCYSVCPVNAITVKSPVEESERVKIGLQLKQYMKQN